jgi:hypothetical protein
MSEYAPEPDGPVNLKVPPHSVEAEQSVLGGLMHNAFPGVARARR